MVNLGGEKMAKSTGHIIGLKEAIERYGGITARLFYLRAHYRSPLEFSEALLEDAASSLERIQRVLDRSSGDADPDQSVLDRFRESMDDDFDTPKALGVLFEAVREANRRADAGEEVGPLVAAVGEIVDVLGIRPVASTATDDDLAAVRSLAGDLGLNASGDLEELLDAVVAARNAARHARDFETSDRIRDDLAGLGIVIEDTADGSRWIRR